MEEKTEKKSGLATAALVLGIVGIGLSFIPMINSVAFLLGILAVIFGLIPLLNKAGKGKAIAGVVLGAAAVIITLAVQILMVRALHEVRDEAHVELDKMTGEKTEEVLKEDVQITFGTMEISTDEYGYVSSKLTATVKNISDERHSFSLHVEAVDENGSRIDDDYIYAMELGAGQSQDFDIFKFIEQDNLEAMKTASFAVIEASVH